MKQNLPQRISWLVWLIFLFPMLAAAQVTVTGKVTAISNGEPLPGVNVVLKGTSTGTITDLDGNYRLNVSGEQPTLVFSFIGYTPEEVVVNNQSEINVTLTEDLTTLSEVGGSGLWNAGEKRCDGSRFLCKR